MKRLLKVLSLLLVLCMAFTLVACNLGASEANPVFTTRPAKGGTTASTDGPLDGNIPTQAPNTTSPDGNRPDEPPPDTKPSGNTPATQPSGNSQGTGVPPSQTNGNNGGIINPDGGMVESGGDINTPNITTTLKISINDAKDSTYLRSTSDFYTTPDENMDNFVTKAIYERNRAAERQLGIVCHYQYEFQKTADGAVDRIFEKSQVGDLPDMYIERADALLRGCFYGCFANVIDRNADSYIDPNAGGWYQEYMNSFSIAPESKLYILASDYYPDVYRYASAVLANEDMIKETVDPDTIYELVFNLQWTFENFVSLASAGYANLGYNPIPTVSLKSAAAHVSDYGSYLEIFANNNTGYNSALSSDLSVLATRLLNFTHLEGTDLSLTSVNEAIERYASGDAAFMLGANIATLEAVQDLGADSFLLPMPLLYEGDVYTSVTSEAACLGAISAETQNFAACTAYLQFCANNSEGLLTEYLIRHVATNCLKSEYGRDMLSVIGECITSPAPRALDNFVSDYCEQSSWDALLQQCLDDQNTTSLKNFSRAIQTKQSLLSELVSIFSSLP